MQMAVVIIGYKLKISQYFADQEEYYGALTSEIFFTPVLFPL